MKFLLLVSFLLITFGCSGQNKAYIFKEVGWKISIPSGFDFTESTGPTDNGWTKSISVLGDDSTNSVIFNVIHFNSSPDSNWQVLKRSIKNVMYLAHLPLANNTDIDTASSEEKIDKLKFEKFHSVLTRGKKYKSSIVFYNHVYSNYILMIQEFFTDKKKGEQLDKIATSSKLEGNN